MEIERIFTVDAPRERVWDVITSPEDVARCLPGCEGVSVVAQGQFRAVVAVRVGPIATKFSIDVRSVEELRPESASYAMSGEEGGRASNVTARTTLQLIERASGETEVTYRSSFQIVGRLGKFGGGVMKRLTESLNDAFVAALQARLRL
jgi:carbon monoxide dehydrogenase subunit G